MKLLYVSDHKFVRKKNGDIYTTGQMNEQYFYKFKEIFDSVTVIGLCEEENESNKLKIIEKLNLDSDFVRYIFIEVSRKKIDRIKALLNIRKKVSALIEHYDRIATKAPSIVNGFVTKLSKKHNVPLLIEVVGCPFDAFWNHSIKGKIIAPIIWSIVKYAIKNASFVMYVTNEFLQNRYPSKGQSIGCSDVSLPPLNQIILEKRINKIKEMDLEKDTIILGTIGAVNIPYKGQKYVIKAIYKLNKIGKKFEYYLVGGGDYTKLKKLVEKYKLNDKVKFLGSMSHENIFSFLDEIDIYIQPSKVEGLPRALIEAISRGCPALGSNVGGIPELLKEEFIFKKGSVRDIFNILKNLDKDSLIKVAKYNFEKAKEFDRNILKEKRNIFYKKFAGCECCK